MLQLKKFKVYEYPIEDEQGHIYYGEYTIKAEVKPLGFENEHLINRFEALVKA